MCFAGSRGQRNNPPTLSSRPGVERLSLKGARRALRAKVQVENLIRLRLIFESYAFAHEGTNELRVVVGFRSKQTSPLVPFKASGNLMTLL
jgi:hypothetical protein